MNIKHEWTSNSFGRENTESKEANDAYREIEEEDNDKESKLYSVVKCSTFHSLMLLWVKFLSNWPSYKKHTNRSTSSFYVEEEQARHCTMSIDYPFLENKNMCSQS